MNGDGAILVVGDSGTRTEVAAPAALPAQVDVRVFSASLDRRALLAEGTNTLPSTFDDTQARLCSSTA